MALDFRALLNEVAQLHADYERLQNFANDLVEIIAILDTDHKGLSTKDIAHLRVLAGSHQPRKYGAK